MISAESKAVAADAKRIYEQQLRVKLEDSQRGRFLAIEPISGDYFLGDSLDEAVNAALEKHPNRLTHTIRVGHPAALHLGVLTQ